MKSPSLATECSSQTVLQSDRTRLRSGDPRPAARPKARAESVKTSFVNVKGRQRLQTAQASSSAGQASGESDLWAALLSSVSQSPLASAQATFDFLDSTAGRLRRLLGPTPHGFPPGPDRDVALEFLSSPLAFLDATVQQHGGAVGLKLGGEHVVLLTDLTLARQVLIDQPEVFVKEGTAFFPGSSLAGNGLLVSDGQIWRRQRQLSNPAFRRSAIASYAAAMGSATRELLHGAWANSGPREVYADLNALTLRITTVALFGSDLPPAESARVTGAIQTAFEYFADRAALGFLIPEWLPTPDNARYHQAVALLDAAVYRIIDARQRQLAGSTRLPQCLLDSLLLARDDGGAGMERRALRDELMTLLVAGQETSAINLAWTLAFLAHHPDAQRRAAEEVQQVLQGGSLTPDSAQQLRYLQAVVLESLRLRPPAYIVGRCAAQSVRLGPHTLPAGTTVLVSPYVMHRSAQHWPRPEAFLPERWLPVLSERPAMAELSGMGSNGAYLPFGAGPRNCIGTGFAMMEAHLVLAQAMSELRFATLPGTEFPRDDARITLRPKLVPLVVERIAGTQRSQ